MAEAATLVSWANAEEKGKIPGSEWVCPMGSIEALGEFERSGGAVTNEIVKAMADGRDHHLELVEFPEGYQAARVVDSETGAVLTDGHSSYEYGGLFTCNCGAVHKTPTLTSILSHNSLPLGEGRELAWVDNFRKGTQSIIKPSRIGNEPDYGKTGVHITPSAKELIVMAEGKAGDAEGVSLDLDIREQNSVINGKLVTCLTDGWNALGQLNLDLDAAGQVEKMNVYKDGFLKMLGVNVEVDLSEHTQWGEITDPDQRARVLYAAAEMFGFDGGWQGLDLKLTASGLYAAMGQRNLALASVLVPRA